MQLVGIQSVVKNPLRKKCRGFFINNCESIIYGSRIGRGIRDKKSNPEGVSRFLPAVFVGDGEFLAGVAAAGVEDAAAVGAGHSGAEAVLVHTLAAGRLECSFHDILFLYFAVSAMVRFFGRTAKVANLSQFAKYFFYFSKWMTSLP